jgi:hypothetical protein
MNGSGDHRLASALLPRRLVSYSLRKMHTMPMKGKRLCKYCRELAEKVSREMSCETLDMAFLDEESP